MEGSGCSSANDASAIHINALPDLVLHKVFSYLDLDDLVSVSSVCRSWNSALQFPGLWKNVVYKIPERATVSDVERTVKNCPFLCNVRLGSGRRKCGKMFEIILKYCNNMQSLIIEEIGHTSKDTLLSALEKFTCLEKLEIDVNEFLEDKEKVAEKLGSLMCLKSLEISYFGYNFPLKPIGDGCPQLIHLNVKNVKYSTDELGYLLRKKKHQLESLHIELLHFESDASLPLQLCRKMESFSCNFISNRFPTQRILNALLSLRGLRRLEFNYWDYLPAVDLINFFHHMSSTNLVELNLSFSKMSDELVDAIFMRCPLIRKLVLNFCSNFPCSWIMKVLQLPHLEHVELECCFYDEEWFVHLLQCKNLRHLKLRRCLRLENCHALQLLELLNLEYLDLSRCTSLTNGFVTGFPQNCSLRHLEILECQFTQENVDVLRRRCPLMKINFTKMISIWSI